MTDFEQTKAELHKLVDGLDETKCKYIGVLKFGFTTIEAIKFELEKCQKESMIEEKLQELGFVNERKALKPSLSYLVSQQLEEDDPTLKIWLNLRGISGNYTLTPPMDNEKEILKCAKFLKELRDE